MAIAGKVAITTGGEWSATVAYDKLVVVTYNNNVYLSIKPSTGVAPTDTEYWMLLIENVTQEQYDAIINGTTPVGNANKLGGKSASEYALISQLFSNAETYRGLDFNTATETKIYSSMGNPSGDGAKNYPIDYTGMLIVFGGSVVSQKYVSFNGFVYERSKLNHADYAWTEWKQTATTADLANYLPKSGGTVQKAGFEPVAVKNTNSGEGVALSFENGDGHVGALGFDGNKKPTYYNAGHASYYELLHTGNKPTGSYTGNGDATQRDIYNDGIGRAIIIRNAYWSTIATNGGAFAWNGQNGTTKIFNNTEVYYNNGTLRLKTAHEAVNSSGSTIGYECL